MSQPAKGKFLSFSAIDLWENCARRYWFERIDGRRSPPSAAMEVGLVYHSAIARMICEPDVTVEDVVTATIETNKERLVGLGVEMEAFPGELSTNLVRLREEVFTKHGFKAYCTPNGKPMVERKFFAEDLRFTGVIDAVSLRTPVVDASGSIRRWKDGLCVFDWKSLSGKRRRSARDAEVSAQLGLYALVMPVVTAACFVEIPRSLDDDIRTRVVEFRPEQLQRFQRWILSTRDAIYAAGDKKELFPMTSLSNGLCASAWCPWYDECYGYDKERPAPEVQIHDKT